jgi:hypothetical protein
MGFVTTNCFQLVEAAIAFGPHPTLGESFTMSRREIVRPLAKGG